MARLASVTPLLQVFDMPLALAFYCGELGFAVVAHSPEVETSEGRFFHWCLLQRDGAQLMLNTAYDSDERPSERDAALWAGHGHTVLFVDCPEIEALHAELAGRGLPVPPVRTSDYGMRQIELTDPDGYGLCFQCPA